ncbi:MAG: hypothetical protein NKF70_03950 [Methanobacterium sp. ERen5]|nr:MAG: hypothetical protein NKF70_03950 [Methanobacterium sp. ERen5]
MIYNRLIETFINIRLLIRSIYFWEEVFFEKNYKIVIGVLAFLILVVAVSGCFSSSKGERTNSTYDGREVSFLYPSDYVVTEVNEKNGQFLKGNNTDDRKFEVSKKVINESLDTFFYDGKQLLIEDPSFEAKIVNEKI